MLPLIVLPLKTPATDPHKHSLSPLTIDNLGQPQGEATQGTGSEGTS